MLRIDRGRAGVGGPRSKQGVPCPLASGSSGQASLGRIRRVRRRDLPVLVSVAATTSDHKLVAQNNRSLFCRRSGGQKSGVKGSAGPRSLRRLSEGPFLGFSSSWGLLAAPLPPRPPPSRGLCSALLCVSLIRLCKDTCRCIQGPPSSRGIASQDRSPA